MIESVLCIQVQVVYFKACNGIRNNDLLNGLGMDRHVAHSHNKDGTCRQIIISSPKIKCSMKAFSSLPFFDL